LVSGRSYRCAPSETEVSELDADEAPAAMDESSSDSKTDNNYSRMPRFTRDQLLAYDGQTLGQPIYVAVLGNVYDVSAGRKFYGPGNYDVYWLAVTAACLVSLRDGQCMVGSGGIGGLNVNCRLGSIAGLLL